MCLEVVNLSDWERVGESLGENWNLQTSLASKEMMSIEQTGTTYTLAPRNCNLK